jgi:hypothetical protein
MCLVNEDITYILRNSMTSGDNGEAPELINLTRPPSFSFSLLNTNLSQIGEDLFPIKRCNINISCLTKQQQQSL